jgi:hypothetical protein
LGAFRFRIQYKEQTSKAEGEIESFDVSNLYVLLIQQLIFLERHMLSVEVNLQWEELSIWVPHISPSMFAEQVGLEISAGVSS